MITLPKSYLLLTPGPLSTSATVKQAMNYDACTWDEDYKAIVTDIRQKLLQIAEVPASDYTTVLMQGSGSFGVEAVLGSCMQKNQHKILILANGVYGERMVAMVKILALDHMVHRVPEHTTFNPNDIEQLLKNDSDITHIAMVHCETTTGLLNSLAGIAELTQRYQKYFIVDAMSSFGGIVFDMQKLHIDFLISSANKCLQGVPGFSFIICKTASLIELCQGQAKSLALDLYSQWLEMENHAGKWRFTSPTHSVLAFQQAIREFFAEGGLASRAKRYQENQAILVAGLSAQGFEPYIAKALQSPIITTFIQPEILPKSTLSFCFQAFYQYLKAKGFVIYPGKISYKNTFRIGNIGHVFKADIENLLSCIQNYITKPSHAI